MTRRCQREGGQATVEVALLLPLLALLLLAVVQVGLVVRDQVLVTHAAREAARAAAVDPQLEAARRGRPRPPGWNRIAWTSSCRGAPTPVAGSP